MSGCGFLLLRFDDFEQNTAALIQSKNAQNQSHDIGHVQALCQGTDVQKDSKEEKDGEKCNNGVNYLIHVHGIFLSAHSMEHIDDFFYECIVCHELVTPHNAKVIGGEILHIGGIANQIFIRQRLIAALLCTNVDTLVVEHVLDVPGTANAFTVDGNVVQIVGQQKVGAFSFFYL